MGRECQESPSPPTPLKVTLVPVSEGGRQESGCWAQKLTSGIPTRVVASEIPSYAGIGIKL
jgi:hypothetical protein